MRLGVLLILSVFSQPGQGPESLNLAACHNCTLLPETCCEVGNRLLDRGTVVGTLADKSIGFFADITNDGEE